MKEIEPAKIFDSPYYIINKNLLTLVGLWPYLSETRKKLSLSFCTVVSFSLIIPIIAGFKNILSVDMVSIIENTIGVLYFVGTYSKYLSAYLFENRIKLVYEQTVMDWKTLTDRDEIQILHKYSKQGRFLTIIYVGYSAMGVFVFNSFPYIPLMLDIILPENETRPRVDTYRPEYFIIDREKYYYELHTCHSAVVVFIATFGAAAIDSMVIANIKHACGLFAVVCYRLENIGKLSKADEEKPLHLANDYDVYLSIKQTCNLHISSIKSVDRIQNSFSLSFLVVMGAGMVAVGMLMFDFLCSLGDPLKLTMVIVLLFGINVCLFYLNWIVQEIINSSENVFQYAYSSQWYNLSVKSQKLMCIIMQNSMKPITLSAGSICDLNLEKYAAVVKTSMSYATVMISMQKQ